MRVICTTLSAALLLSACAVPPTAITPNASRGSGGAKPNMDGANWQSLGVSPSGNILNELDQASIKRQGSVVTFRDRKTIFNLKKENFLSTPKHKFSINTWQIDCSQRTFRLLNIVLFDENNRQLSNFTYNGSQIKAMPIVQNSASYQQMLLVCQSNR